MPAEDQRERDQMWKRIDQHGSRLNDIEQGLVEVKGKADENSRMISSAAESASKMQASVDILHSDMSQLIGAAKTIKWLFVLIGGVWALVQLAEALGADIPI